MNLAKLTIAFEKGPGQPPGRIQALFNPNHLHFDNRVSWRHDQSALDARIAEHRRLSLEGIEPTTFTLDLFFDTYEGGGQGAFGGAVSAALTPLGIDLGVPSASDVRAYTDQIVALTHYVKDLHRPPVCDLSWGRWALFKGVLSSLTQEFTLFLPDGTPVRADLGCTFTEYQTEDDALRGELHSADVAKKRTVRPGDTLINIAIEAYGDASLWRRVAAANRIERPRDLTPGQVLDIPPIA